MARHGNQLAAEAHVVLQFRRADVNKPPNDSGIAALVGSEVCGEGVAAVVRRPGICLAVKPRDRPWFRRVVRCSEGPSGGLALMMSVPLAVAPTRYPQRLLPWS